MYMKIILFQPHEIMIFLTLSDFFQTPNFTWALKMLCLDYLGADLYALLTRWHLPHVTQFPHFRRHWAGNGAFNTLHLSMGKELFSQGRPMCQINWMPSSRKKKKPCSAAVSKIKELNPDLSDWFDFDCTSLHHRKQSTDCETTAELQKTILTQIDN